MKRVTYLLLCPLLMFMAACDVEKEATEDHNITATINGETWYFYDASLSAAEGGASLLKANGYIMGEEGNAEPAELEITFTGLSSPSALQEGYVADFAPTSTGNSAFAVLRLPDQSLMFDTKLDPQTQGTFTVESVEEDKMSGSFTFVAKDQLGRTVTVESGDFKNVRLEQ